MVSKRPSAIKGLGFSDNILVDFRQVFDIEINDASFALGRIQP